MYSQIEEECLQFIQRGHITQASENRSPDDNHADLHFDIWLPASFIGSPEWASNETSV